MFRKVTKLFKRYNFFQIAPSRAQGTKEVDMVINGKPVKVPAYFTILQACNRENVTVPCFCFHERLSIAGNCRMCFVEVVGMPKLQISCACNVAKGMEIRTNSPDVLRARESVLEFLLVDHPLDCPICDQGGECDLQDLSMNFGNDRSRFTDIHFTGKRALEDNDLGPLIRSKMTRCIHCTRCIRFGSQVCGIDVLGSTGRGSEMLVGTYVDKMFLSELSGNIIDLCPVGALTSIPYMFKARPWEVKMTNSIDVTDATGTNIVVNHRGDRVLRILPREHEEINQEWLSDKGRWAIDSLEMQRLVTPMQRVNNCLCGIEWDCALALAADIIVKCPPAKLMAVAGSYCNCETLVATKDLLNGLGSEHTYTERDLTYTDSNSDLRTAYCLNVNMKDIAKADKILLVGTNPRFEAPILNAWIRMAFRNNECDIYIVGPSDAKYNYHVNHIGSDINAIKNAGKAMEGAKKPLIFVGVAQLGTENGAAIMKELVKLAASLPNSPDWGVLNVIPREASFVGALEAGWKPNIKEALKNCAPDVLISLGADDLFYDWSPPSSTKVIYIGFQGDRGSASAQVVLPGSAYTEQGGTYLNMEGRSQYAMPAVTPPGNARHDWKIIRALAEYCGVGMHYTDQDSLSCRMAQISPNFSCLGFYQQKIFSNLLPTLVKSGKCTGGNLDVDMKTLVDYYCSDIFTFNSPTMVKARKAACEYESTAYAIN